MFSFKNVIDIKKILLSLFLFTITKEYIVLPLKTFKQNNFTQVNNSKFFNSQDFLDYWLPNDMYTHLYIGSPPSKVYAFLDFENYGSHMDNSICELPSKYDNESSSTFKSISNYIIAFSHFSNMCFATETFSAYANFNLNEKELKPMKNITFLYAVKPYNDTAYSKLYYRDFVITYFSCFHIGLQLPISLEYYESWIKQLKKKDFIESTYWTIEFKDKYGLFDVSNDDENENEALFVIGLPPHKYNPNRYTENAFRTTVSKVRIKNYEDFRVNLWGVIFDKIYFFTNNSTHDEITLKSTKCKFELNKNLIEGSTNYLNNIENEFFNELYNKSICVKEKIWSQRNGIYWVISCDKNYYNEIKKFPTLYFKSSELEYVFELTYEDLFAINGDKIFFMVIFRNREALFTFGKLFFKKYFFTFSYDNKIIGFYDEKILAPPIYNNSETNLTNKIIIIILGIVFMFIFFIGFIKIKKTCLSDRQKRMNELIDDNYVYMVNKGKITSNKDKSLNIIN